jgi:hypothetical protein
MARFARGDAVRHPSAAAAGHIPLPPAGAASIPSVAHFARRIASSEKYFAFQAATCARRVKTSGDSTGISLAAIDPASLDADVKVCLTNQGESL